MKKAVRIALTGVLAALAVAVGYLEFLLPSDIAGIPGIKPGFANILVMAALYLLGTGEAAFVCAAKITVSWLVFGSFTSFLYSLCGGVLSFAVMVLLKKTNRFGHVGVSVGGAVTHNVGQTAVAALMLGSGYVFYYLPVLLVAAAVTGTLNGLIIKAALPPLSKALHRTE
ncbi:MAG: Gx transporter family protein [Clostridia bacterium]|nr:Gx transporter family protein [Clostridia bacterium]